MGELNNKRIKHHNYLSLALDTMIFKWPLFALLIKILVFVTWSALIKLCILFCVASRKPFRFVKFPIIFHLRFYKVIKGFTTQGEVQRICKEYIFIFYEKYPASVKNYIKNIDGAVSVTAKASNSQFTWIVYNFVGNEKIKFDSTICNRTYHLCPSQEDRNLFDQCTCLSRHKRRWEFSTSHMHIRKNLFVKVDRMLLISYPKQPVVVSFWWLI